MKILITHERFPPNLYGGGERVVYELAKRLKLKGFGITVLTTGNPKIKEFESIPTIRLPIHRYLMNLAIPQIYRHARGVDLIQTNNYNACFPSLMAGKMLRKPVVCIVHCIWRHRWSRIRGSFLGSVSRLVEWIQLHGSYDKFIFLSDFARNEGLKLGIPESLTRVIRPGIEYYKYRVAGKEDFALFVGRLSKQKGIYHLMEAANELPDIQFKIAGMGEEGKRVRSSAPKNVAFLGFLSEEELVDLYSRARVFCLPSIAETFGLVILEAMASGCAIVSTVPLDYEGVKVDIGNAGELKEAIRFLFENRDLSLKMGKINRRKAMDYSWDSFIAELIGVYEEITSAKRM